MSRVNPFCDLGDFAPQPKSKPVAAGAIEQLAQDTGFPSRKAAGTKSVAEASAPPRAPRRRTTGRNRQINIKATEDTIERLYHVADALDLPLGAVLAQALDALEQKSGITS